MSKPLMVHVITNFAGVGGAEMMLARLIQQTEHDYQHVIISLMKTSDVYAETLARCSAYYALGWNGLNSLLVLKELKKLIHTIAPVAIQAWMYHANVMSSLAVRSLKTPVKLYWGIHHSLASPKEES